MCSRTQENNVNKVDPILWDTLQKQDGDMSTKFNFQAGVRYQCNTVKKCEGCTVHQPGQLNDNNNDYIPT